MMREKWGKHEGIHGVKIRVDIKVYMGGRMGYF